MDIDNQFLVLGVFFGILILFIIFIVLVVSYLNVNFEYPYIEDEIDLTNKKQPDYDEYIDQWIIDKKIRSQADIEEIFNTKTKKWENDCKKIISESLWKKHANELFSERKEVVYSDNYKIFIFHFYRTHTRYKQKNYKKTSYLVKDYEPDKTLSLKELILIVNELSDFDFRLTRKKSCAKNEPISDEKKQYVKIRDNYTCQSCGRYMPDGFGLEIDHITPKKLGGTNEVSNLQVLCSTCNRKKGARLTVEQPKAIELNPKEFFGS